MNILLTNDDGYTARGLMPLVRVMRQFGTLTVIAPKYHQSGTGMSVSMGFKKIAVKQLAAEEGERWMYLDGTPASCVKFGIDNVFTDGLPDMVVSGVNHGSNAGAAACYSGTLGAALEGAINRVPVSIAVSLDDMSSDCDFSAVEELLPGILRKLLPLVTDKYGVAFNINFPAIPASSIKGVRMCHQGIGHWIEEFEEWDDSFTAGRDMSAYGLPEEEKAPEDGEKLYIMLGRYEDFPFNAPDADHRLLKAGYVTITVHNLDTTDYDELARLRAAGIDEDF